MADMQKIEAVLYFASKAQFHILECEALAKALDASDKMTFNVVGPTGHMPCRWVDAHYGTFERADGKPGAFHTRQFQFVRDVHCENLDNFS